MYNYFKKLFVDVTYNATVCHIVAMGVMATTCEQGATPNAL